MEMHLNNTISSNVFRHENTFFFFIEDRKHKALTHLSQIFAKRDKGSTYIQQKPPESIAFWKETIELLQNLKI